ncbi:MAG: DEAD/DEAH box helicase [Acidimicrobiales bacterium]
MHTSFSDLGVPERLVTRLARQGITSPFPIQSATIPDALAGRDVCGRAPTGSGKTIAFGVAVVSAATGSLSRRPRALVLVPTRELAAQVQGELALLAGDNGRRTLAVYGGTGYGASRKALERGVDIVVACPGRLEDLLQQGVLSLADVQTVVVDEADRMADMGFLPAVRRLLDKTSSRRQVLLFSATIGREVETLVASYQHDPVRHDVVADESSVGAVAHVFWRAERSERVRLAARLVSQHGRAVVFCRTRRGADRVAKQLTQAGISAVAIHGDRTQAQRERALAAFSQGRAHALVATDVAARGIHVEDLPCVVHFDPPTDATDYLHRSGRTGRAGRDGTVVSFVTDADHATVRGMQRTLGLAQGFDAPDGPSTATVTTALSALQSSGVKDAPKGGGTTRSARSSQGAGAAHAAGRGGPRRSGGRGRAGASTPKQAGATGFAQPRRPSAPGRKGRPQYKRAG